ncbi:LysR family transcriptional regulator [Telmatospirillum siberiense]|uniref:LysR family transcriptional regulator n=1 Tax=Telmatospirillum siberiense TaxID=382514 RepID=A0A2N3PP48_9PROT|nr:LysR family transcriptional regulator [Telmatospirillum siberiense]PKU22170.1 LysR family transcriptional regulator [Telmatospirillum siberiense]
MTVDPNGALAFVKVVQEGSFTAAARALGLPKATLSRRIGELETSLGIRLLNRTTRRLGLTEAGTVYYRHCQGIALALTEAQAAVDQLRSRPQGWLRITTSFSLVNNLLTPLLGEFRDLYPEVRIDLALGHEPLDLIAQGIDLALRMGPLPDSSLTARRLAVFPNRIYAAPTYLARHGEPRHPDELAGHPALATRIARRGEGYAWPMSDGGELRDYPIDPVVVADDPEALKGPLLGGCGLMMATDMIMRRLIEDGRVQPLLPGWTGRRPELHAIFPQGPVQPPKLRVFVDFLADRLTAFR